MTGVKLTSWEGNWVQGILTYITSRMAVRGNGKFLPETRSLAGLVVERDCHVVGGVLGGSQDDPVVGLAIIASDGRAGEGRCGADGAQDWLLGLVASHLEADGLDGAVVLAQPEVGDVDVLVDCRAGLAAVSGVGAVAGLGLRSRGCERSSEERGGGDELHVEDLM
jgi:hypothetical protein